MIVAAAIQQNGITYPGDRHHLIIREIYEATKIRPVTGDQGFIDENGDFLTREEAAIDAIACGQIEKLKYSKTKLYSEELWEHYEKD